MIITKCLLEDIGRTSSTWTLVGGGAKVPSYLLILIFIVVSVGSILTLVLVVHMERSVTFAINFHNVLLVWSTMFITSLGLNCNCFWVSNCLSVTDCFLTLHVFKCWNLGPKTQNVANILPRYSLTSPFIDHCSNQVIKSNNFLFSFHSIFMLDSLQKASEISTGTN